MTTKKKENPVKDEVVPEEIDEEVKKEDKENSTEDTKTDEGQPEKEENATTEEDDSDKETFETKYLRMTADFQNYKRRAEKEKSDIYTYANEKFAIDLLEVLDNFERAIEQDRKNEADEQFLKGMEMILKQFTEVLKKNNIEEINCLGEKFDPNFHHAVAMECSDKYDKGCVAEVMQKGYTIKDKVIRPSMVKVTE